MPIRQFKNDRIGLQSILFEICFSSLLPDGQWWTKTWQEKLVYSLNIENKWIQPCTCVVRMHAHANTYTYTCPNKWGRGRWILCTLYRFCWFYSNFFSCFLSPSRKRKCTKNWIPTSAAQIALTACPWQVSLFVCFHWRNVTYAKTECLNNKD